MPIDVSYELMNRSYASPPTNRMIQVFLSSARVQYFQPALSLMGISKALLLRWEALDSASVQKLQSLGIGTLMEELILITAKT